MFATSVNNIVQYVQVWCICEVHRVYSMGKGHITNNVLSKVLQTRK
jgi:hypothetical protein